MDLFSGIGGLTLALAPWVQPIAYCENDRYAQSVMLSRMATGDLPVAPIWDDIRTLPTELCLPIDIVYAGFPCQDISVAGRRAGLAGERSGLFFEIIRLARELRPKFIFLENVAGITSGNMLESVSGAITEVGYDCRWGMLRAYDLGAPHLRERWFCLAYSESFGCRQRDTYSARCGRTERKSEKEKRSGLAYGDRWWEIEPNVGRVVDGVPFRVDRIRGLGNAVVPQQAREAFKRLMGFEKRAEELGKGSK